MEKIDKDLAARVWNRVQRASGRKEEKALPQEPPQLQALIARLWVDAAICRRLIPRFRGADRKALEQIAGQKQACTARLKGVCAMQTGSQPRIPAPPVPKGTPQELLRICCDGTAACASQLERLSAMPGYSGEYAQLARQAHSHHRQLLGLLGSLM